MTGRALFPPRQKQTLEDHAVQMPSPRFVYGIGGVVVLSRVRFPALVRVEAFLPDCCLMLPDCLLQLISWHVSAVVLMLVVRTRPQFRVAAGQSSTCGRRQCHRIAIGFQAPLLTLLVLRTGMFTREQLARSRRGIWFAAFVLGAFLSPPDPLSLFLVSLPVMLLFEAAMVVDRFTRS